MRSNKSLCSYHCVKNQEALLPQTDRATLNFSRNRVNCYTTDAEQIEVIELEHYGRMTCGKTCVSVHDASTVVGKVNKLDRRRVLLTTRSTCRDEIF